MYFYNSDHETNFSAMLKEYPQARNDKEYRVACYIIAHPEIFSKATAQKWENIFDDWMEQDFSAGIRLLVDLGLHLYGGGSHSFNLLNGIATWDTASYQVFQTACEIRKGWA